MWKRTHYCAELTKSDINAEVVLCGWVNKRRDHGGIIFVDLRDRTGIAQIVFNPEVDTISHNEAQRIRSEFVICAKGKVEFRPADMVNPNLKTGEIEVFITDFEILSEAETPPFPIEEKA